MLLPLPVLLEYLSLLRQLSSLSLDLFQNLLKRVQLWIVLVEVLHSHLLLIEVVADHLCLSELPLSLLQLVSERNESLLKSLTVNFHLLSFLLDQQQFFLLLIYQVPLCRLDRAELISEVSDFVLVLILL